MSLSLFQEIALLKMRPHKGFSKTAQQDALHEILISATDEKLIPKLGPTPYTYL